MKRITPYLLVLLASLFTACRRDLWVYTDQFRQIELETDWSSVRGTPDGMTWWFMNRDHSGRNYHETTADVTHAWLYLPRGIYDGVVFDYSPAEYSHQEFVGMTHGDSALVHQLLAADQPGVNQHLYGDYAVPDYLTSIPRNPSTGMYQVGAEPEVMHADALHDVEIKTGEEGELVRWEYGEDYEANQPTITLRANPQAIVWHLYVNVYVKGLQHMSGVRGSIAGLADGCWLGSMRHTSTPCLQVLDSWGLASSNGEEGYIRASVGTFGMPDREMPASFTETRAGDVPEGVDLENSDDETGGIPTQIGERLQLNLQFLLRDGSTVKNYHYDLGRKYIAFDGNQLILEITIPADYTGDGGEGSSDGAPDLPYVESSDGAGFDADVTPWEDGGTADETM